MKTVRDVMTSDVVTIEVDKTVYDAAKLMTEKSVGCLIVTSGEGALGILTERDLVSKVMSEPFDPKKVRVSDVMTTPVFTTSSDKTVGEAADLMVKYRVRRLPVVDDGALVGICTSSDLAKTLADFEGAKVVVEAVTRQKMLAETGPYR